MNSYQLHSQTLPNNSSHLHHNNYSDRTSSTNSHTSSFQPHHNIVWRIVIHRNFFISFFITDFKTISSQQLHHNNFITNFHNILWYSSSQYHARVSEDHSSHTFTTLSQTLHRIFQQLSTHLHHASTNSSTSFNKMNEYRFSFTAYSTNYDTVLHQHSFTFISTNHDTILYLLQQHTSSFSSSHLQQTNWNTSSTNTSTNSSIKSSTTNFMMRIIHFNKCIRKSWYNVRHMLYNLFTTLFTLHRIFITTIKWQNFITSSSNLHRDIEWQNFITSSSQQFWYRTSTNTSSNTSSQQL